LTLMEYMQHAEETFATPHGAFEVLDADGDRNSTREEFQAGSAIFKRPPFRYPADMFPIFDEIDSNKDGLIQNTEFYHATPSAMESKWHLNMTDLKDRARNSYGFLDSYYTAMDINSDGKVDLAEFVRSAGALEPPVPAEDAEALFHQVDADGIGFVEPREWVSYVVNGTFVFATGLQPDILPTGAKVMLAVEIGLKNALEVQEFDLLTVNSVEDVTGQPGVDAEIKKTTGPEAQQETSRRLSLLQETNLKKVVLRVAASVLVGTRVRQKEMQTEMDSLPNDQYMIAFANSISGGSTTLPAGPPPTLPPQKSGPLSDDELVAYMDVPAVLQGHTELLLSNANAGVHSVEEQENARLVRRDDQIVLLLLPVGEEVARHLRIPQLVHPTQSSV